MTRSRKIPVRCPEYLIVPVAVAGCMLAVTGFGCSRSGSLPGMVPVRGTVTFEGKPVEQGTVSLIPVEGNTARPASGTIEHGNFKIMTTASSPGALPGKYRVMIISQESLPVASPVTPSSVTTMQSGEPDPSTVGQGPVAMNIKSLIPKKYANPADSGLEVEVAKKMSPLLFELKP